MIVQVDDDYARLKSVGIRTVRDAVRWHLIERDGTFDFSSLAPMVVAAERHGMQVMWTLLHYGVPDDVDIFSVEFPNGFARFSAEVAGVHSEPLETAARSTRPSTRFPFSRGRPEKWDGSAPFAKGRGAELKRQLVKAAIASL